MPWIIEYVHDWWWTYDPSDGQLLYNDGEDYVHIEYVSTGWKEASEAVAEYFEDFYSYSEESSQEDSDEEESNEEDSDEDDNGNDISDDDDTTEEDTTDEDTTDEDTTDEDEEEEEAYNPYENPYKYRLFNTRNPNGYCVGLSLYWAKERLTTGYSLTDSMPDYSEAEETHLWFRTMTKKLNFPDTLNVLLEDDPLVFDYEVFAGENSIDNALDAVCAREGTYMLCYYNVRRPVGHAVAIHREGEEVGYFNSNVGVFDLPSDEELCILVRYQIDKHWPADDNPQYYVRLIKLSV